MGIFVAPFASTYDDGLEYVGSESKLGFSPTEENAAPTVPPLFPDYQVPGLERFSLKAATAVAGGIGTIVVFGFSIALAWSLKRLTPVGMQESAVAEDIEGPINEP